MKKLFYTVLVSLGGTFVLAQTPDTTRINLGESEVLIIKKQKGTITIDDDTEKIDTIDASLPAEEIDKSYSHDGRWAGIDFGAMMLMNGNFESSFPNDKQWENDAARSLMWNFNIMDYRFNLYKEYVGITTGLGFNITQVGFKNNYLLQENADSLWVTMDTVTSYRRNKLRATYLQVPLLLEFNTNEDADKAFYFAAGVVGGLRIGSSLRRRTEDDGSNTKVKIKGTYGLNPFKVDATVRLGYGDWGAFANYSLTEMFDTAKTTEVYPLSFGISYNF